MERTYNQQAVAEIENWNKQNREAAYTAAEIDKTKYNMEFCDGVKKIIAKYECSREVIRKFENGVKEIAILDKDGRIVATYHE